MENFDRIIIFLRVSTSSEEDSGTKRGLISLYINHGKKNNTSLLGVQRTWQELHEQIGNSDGQSKNAQIKKKEYSLC